MLTHHDSVCLSDKLEGSVSQILSVSKRLFDGVEVEPPPALPGGLLLPRRDSSTLHPQLCLISSVLQLQTDGGVVLAGPGPEPPPHLDPPVQYQLCKLSTDTPVQHLEPPSTPTVHCRRRAREHLHKLLANEGPVQLIRRRLESFLQVKVAG